LKHTEKKLEDRHSVKNSKILLFKCSAMMERKDQPLMRSELIHGCKQAVISRKSDMIFWSNLTIRDLTPHKLHLEKIPV